MAYVLLFAGMKAMHSRNIEQVRHPHIGEKLEESLFFEARDFFSALEADILRAQSSICVEMYIWSNDEIGARFHRLLEDAARRGVDVRIVLDGVGSWLWIRAHHAELIEGNAKIRIFAPVRWPALFSRYNGLSRFLARINRRNHKKVIVIDQKIAFTGSLNVTHHSLQWKECGLRITGHSVPLLQELFEDVWARAEGLAQNKVSPHPPLPRQLAKRLLHSRSVRSNQFLRLRRARMKELKLKIANARQRVWMITPYFVPTFGVLMALLKAARRGVDVRLILPRKTDVWFTRWVAHLYYRFMLKAGIRVFEYLPRILHAKVTMIDSWAYVGSSNLNRRSSFLDLELDIVLGSPTSRNNLAIEFQRNLGQSEEIFRPEPMRFWRHALARFFFLWRGWL